MAKRLHLAGQRSLDPFHNSYSTLLHEMGQDFTDVQYGILYSSRITQLNDLPPIDVQ